MISFYKLRLTWLEMIHNDVRCPQTKKKLESKIAYYKDRLQEVSTTSSHL
ncbi:hypothetical protein [Planococcus shenhongbingii]|uniref:Uncharacterized protein n=1 Tax=Planococcus shenhongbingii TaxID=3058398 RepID=A0ABT8N9R6_9BACL|nr:hypothetical protein [Planococcus sp. N017]MDN7244629.1 hypothetical protein [Planococcus sp. N017]